MNVAKTLAVRALTLTFGGAAALKGTMEYVRLHPDTVSFSFDEAVKNGQLFDDTRDAIPRDTQLNLRFYREDRLFLASLHAATFIRETAESHGDNSFSGYMGPLQTGMQLLEIWASNMSGDSYTAANPSTRTAFIRHNTTAVKTALNNTLGDGLAGYLDNISEFGDFDTDLIAVAHEAAHAIKLDEANADLIMAGTLTNQAGQHGLWALTKMMHFRAYMAIARKLHPLAYSGEDTDSYDSAALLFDFHKKGQPYPRSSEIAAAYRAILPLMKQHGEHVDPAVRTLPQGLQRYFILKEMLQHEDLPASSLARRAAELYVEAVEYFAPRAPDAVSGLTHAVLR